MKYSEINGLSESEIKEKLKSEKEILLKLKFAHAVSPIENPTRITASRKLVARLNTALRAKEMNNPAS